MSTQDVPCVRGTLVRQHVCESEPNPRRGVAASHG